MKTTVASKSLGLMGVWCDGGIVFEILLLPFLLLPFAI